MNVKKQTLSIVLICLFLVRCSPEKAGLTKDVDMRKPNIIVIFADDLGYGDLSCYGHPTIVTPNIDRLATEGQKWTNFYAAASVCTPSRAGLMTGRYPVRSGMCSDQRRVLFPNSSGGLPASEITIAEQLKKAGYATTAIGKWHLGHLNPYLPTNNGFDAYFGIPYSNDMNQEKALDAGVNKKDMFWNPKSEYFDVPILKDTVEFERPANQTTLTKRYNEAAIQFVKDNKDTSFFLYLAHNLPHVPLFASEAYQGMSKRGLYGDVVQEIDAGVGQLIKTLEELNIQDNTLIIFTSDNGPWLSYDEHGGSAGMLRDGKGTTWEGGMRVPAVFWGPGMVKPGIITGLGSTLDIFSTASKLAGVPIPEERVVDGVDLSSTLTGLGDSPRKNFFYYRGTQIYAARMGDFKLHYITESEYVRDKSKIIHEQPVLYNVNVDPSEKYEISEEFKDIVKEIDEMVKEHKKGVVPVKDQLADTI